jgi:hypothetical protein
MTGKEALKEWIDHYIIDCHKYCGNSFLEKLKVIKKDLDKLDKVEEKLTKYKRAFEILEDRLMLKIYQEEYHYKQLYTLESSKEVRLEKEEYELLEELTKSENSI